MPSSAAFLQRGACAAFAAAPRAPHVSSRCLPRSTSARAGDDAPPASNTLTTTNASSPTSRANGSASDAGDADTPTVSGIIWVDRNGNALRESNETGLANATLLFIPDDSVADNTAEEAEAETDADGSYAVALAPGTYEVKVNAEDATYVYSLTTTLVVEDEDATQDFRVEGKLARRAYNDQLDG